MRHLEILVPYLNNPYEETIFGSNKIKEQHETMKLQNFRINELNRPAVTT